MDESLEEALCKLPAGAPPDGTPNFVDPPTLAPTVIAVSSIMMAAAVIFTTGRLIANWRKLAWSDHFCLLATILSIGQGGLMLAQSKYARHQWDIPACWFLGKRGAWYAKVLFSQQMMLVPGLFFSKASIFVLFGQLFTLEDSMQWAVRIGLVFDFLIHFTSIPVEAYFNAPGPGELWDNLMLSGKPVRALTWGIIQSALNIVLDLYIFILPLPIIAKLTLSPRKRLKVVAVFSTAFMGVVANIVSLVYRVEERLAPEDQTWNLAALLLCTVVELNIAIIVSSVPGFAKFVRLYISELAPIKSIRTRLYLSDDSRATGSQDSKNKPRTGRDDPARKRQADDSWLLNTGASTEIGSSGGANEAWAAGGVQPTKPPQGDLERQ